MALDLMKMRYFARIAELGSFTRAASELGVAQPALSLHVRALEEQLGLQLLNRTSRGVVVTEAGQTLLLHAQAILRAVEQAEAATREQAKYPSGDVSLGILSSLSPILSIPIMEECDRRFPKIRLTISEGDSQTLRVATDTHGHDLAVNLLDVAKPTAVPLFDERLYAVGPLNVFADRDGDLPVREALSLPLIMPTQRHGIRILLERQALILGHKINIVRVMEGVASTKARCTRRAWLDHSGARGSLCRPSAGAIVGDSSQRTRAVSTSCAGYACQSPADKGGSGGEKHSDGGDQTPWLRRTLDLSRLKNIARFLPSDEHHSNFVCPHHPKGHASCF